MHISFYWRRELLNVLNHFHFVQSPYKFVLLVAVMSVTLDVPRFFHFHLEEDSKDYWYAKTHDWVTILRQHNSAWLQDNRADGESLVHPLQLLLARRRRYRDPPLCSPRLLQRKDIHEGRLARPPRAKTQEKTFLGGRREE